MNYTQPSIRKAAILVSSLDTETADALLDQMSRDQADAVRRAVIDLPDVDPSEQDEVIGEFVRVRPLVPKNQPAGIELDDRLARRLAAPESIDSPSTAPRGPRSDPPAEPAKLFRFLAETDSTHLAAHLKEEHPQTIAVVLSHSPPERAADVVALLPGRVQSDVLERLAELDHTDPDILRDVEQGLQSRLSGNLPPKPSTGGLKAVADILSASGSRHAREILDNINRHNTRLSGRLARCRLSFADLEALDDTTLAVIFDAADTALVKLALAGASSELAERVLSWLPPARAQSLQQAMHQLGPTRLSDLEEAQRQIADLAHELEAEGRIDLPRSVQCQ